MDFFITELRDLNILELINNKQTILGLDVGDKNIGVSIADRNLKIASGITTIHRKDKIYINIDEIQKISKSYKVGAIIFGWPIQMNGVPGQQCKKVLNFIFELQNNIPIPFCRWDERFSTCVVDDVLIKANMSRKKRKKVIDKNAAVYILQGALDFLNRNKTINNSYSN